MACNNNNSSKITGKENLKNALLYLRISADEIKLGDELFWNRILSEDCRVADETLSRICANEIRMLRDGRPKNFAMLAYKMVELLYQTTGTLCNTNSQQLAVLNAAKVLTKIIPCMFEDGAWSKFFFDNSLVEQEEKNDKTANKKSGKQVDDNNNCDLVNLMYPKKRNQAFDFNLYLPPSISNHLHIATNKNEQLSLKHEDDNDNNNNDNDNQERPNTFSLNDLIDDDNNEFLCCADKDEMPSHIELDVDKSSSSSPTAIDTEKYTNADTIKDYDKSKQTIDKNCLAHKLITSICDLLFCPEFTVTSKFGSTYHAADCPPDDIRAIDTCECVWEPGVGFDSDASSTFAFDKARIELLRLLLACLSSTLYKTPTQAASSNDLWFEIFSTKQNRHVLPLFTSLLNTVFGYRVGGLQLPFSSLMFSDNRAELVHLCLQVLIATLDYNLNVKSAAINSIRKTSTKSTPDFVKVPTSATTTTMAKKNCVSTSSSSDCDYNLFLDYLSRIHRQSDFMFILKGLSHLLNHSASSSSFSLLFTSTLVKRVEFEQELLIFLWQILNSNHGFLEALLKAQEIFDIITPIVLHLNANFQDASKTAFVHVAIFNLLVLSGERNFGVRLNKPYQTLATEDLQPFTGSHADLFVVVFHKLIYYGQAHLFRLFDYLLSILANISPYIKALSMLASQCLVELFEIFSSTSVIFTNSRYHQSVIFLLEIFNNIVQYQFDGNANLICAIIRKRQVFYNLARLPTSKQGIQKVMAVLVEAKKQHDKLIRANDEQKSTNKKQSIKVSSSKLGTKPKADFDVDSQIDFSKSIDATLSSEHSSGAQCLAASNEQTTLSQRQKQSQQDTSDKLAPASKVGIVRREVSLVATPEIEEVTSPVSMLSARDSLKFEFSSQDQSVECTNELAATNKIASDECKLSDDNWKDKKNVDSDQQHSSFLSINPKYLHGWAPNPSWVRHYKASLPLQTMLRMLSVLEPQLSRFEKKTTFNESELIKFIQNGTLVGLLPVPHAIFFRKYRTNYETLLWFRTCSWGTIYVQSSTWADTCIKLVTIKL